MTIPPSHQSATSSCAPKPMSPQHLSFFAQPCLALLGRENSWPGQHAQLVPWKIDHFYLLGVGEATAARSYLSLHWCPLKYHDTCIFKYWNYRDKKEGLGMSGMSWIVACGSVVVKALLSTGKSLEWYSPCQEAMLSFRHRHHLPILGHANMDFVVIHK